MTRRGLPLRDPLALARERVAKRVARASQPKPTWWYRAGRVQAEALRTPPPADVGAPPAPAGAFSEDDA